MGGHAFSLNYTAARSCFRDVVDQLQDSGKVNGILVQNDNMSGIVEEFSPDRTCPNVDFGQFAFGTVICLYVPVYEVSLYMFCILSLLVQNFNLKNETLICLLIEACYHDGTGNWHRSGVSSY